MPPRLSRPPDPNDPEYQRLERHINFALHVGIFTASNSCIWFVRSVNYASWQWSLWVTSLWLVCLLGHGIWMFSRDQKGEIKP
jgi:2TM domain